MEMFEKKYDFGRRILVGISEYKVYHIYCFLRKI